MLIYSMLEYDNMNAVYREFFPVDPVTGGLNLGPIAEQIRQTLRNMAHMLVRRAE